ncbi:hypothetical protein VNI00_018223 [Paramarasmius palmivorus]|uniref:AB hydrolase-1 domain-containing protein n=1 Tax=Paramarasmius palmivorus TaxID=297713 RepID=A0AAW0AYY1_9AGAR
MAALEESSYKDLKVSRGFSYHYFASPSKERKPLLFLIHGFGAASQDWRHQVPFFQSLGYGIIAPDCLNYGSSSVTEDPKQLKFSLIAKDFVELLQHENATRAVFIGQSGGSPLVSRISQLYPEVVIGSAFLGTPYSVPTPPPFDLDKLLRIQKEMYGYELFGYWEFLGKDPDAGAIATENFEALFNVTYPDDPKSWIRLFGPRGALKEYLLAGPEGVLPAPSWFPSDEDKRLQYSMVQTQNLPNTFTYYTSYVDGTQSEDGTLVPHDRYTLTKPTLFGYGAEDYIALPSMGKDIMTRFCTNLTIKEFAANHWMHLHVPEEVNRVLLEWITSFDTSAVYDVESK